MSKSTTTGMQPTTAPTGFWKAICVIAERLPQNQLIYLAMMLCLLVLLLGYLGFASVDRAAESKPARALAGYIKQRTLTKAKDVP